MFYVGSALSFAQKDPVEIHNEVYQGLEKVVTNNQFIDMTSSSDYLSTVKNDPVAYWQQLSFYRPKLIYSCLILLFSYMGVNIFLSTSVISGLSVILSLWLALILFKTVLPRLFLLIIPLIGFQFGAFELARISTPDGLALFMTTLVIFLLFKRIKWMLILLPFLTLVRPDLFPFSILMLMGIYFISPKTSKYILILACCAIGIYLFSNKILYGYGWLISYSMAFNKLIPYPATTTVSFSLSNYFKIIIGSFRATISGDKAFLAYLISLVVLLKILTKKNSMLPEISLQHNKLVVFLIASLGYMLAHFFAFPSMQFRFFVGQYFITTCFMLVFISSLFQDKVISPKESSSVINYERF
jgi:hypothetical protein